MMDKRWKTNECIQRAERWMEREREIETIENGQGTATMYCWLRRQSHNNRHHHQHQLRVIKPSA